MFLTILHTLTTYSSSKVTYTLFSIVSDQDDANFQ
jgi:hypothetical protein